MNEPSTPKRINIEHLGLAATVPYSPYNADGEAFESLNKM